MSAPTELPSSSTLKATAKRNNFQFSIFNFQFLKIIHTADLHLGQIMYHYYDRVDEHDHFFSQLRGWCAEYRPDALIVSGDVFDIPQPSAVVKEYFNRTFVQLHRDFPDIAIVITAGNHDSASRIEADRSVWGMSGVTLIGHGPKEFSPKELDAFSVDVTNLNRFIVELPSGFIVAMPYMTVNRREVQQALLDRVAELNVNGLPVVMMAHTAIAGGDFLGHGEIGTVKTTSPDEMGSGFDYLALGHIHRPQTIGMYIGDESLAVSHYQSPVMRYSGSALHVSCDEHYPHSVSLVEIDRHDGDVTVTRLRIDELRHFYIVPPLDAKPAASAEEVEVLLSEFCRTHERGYLRLNLDYRASDLNLRRVVYPLLEATNNEVRYNPNAIWQNRTEVDGGKTAPVFEVTELSQMTDPLEFVRKTIEHYPSLNPDTLEADFAEIEKELMVELCVPQS